MKSKTIDRPPVDWVVLSGRRYPIAWVVLRTGGIGRHAFQQWEIIRCPYCGKRHWHGGGAARGAWIGDGTFAAEADDPRQYLGHRVEHCHDNVQDPNRRGYILREAPSGKAAP